jgi:hypothetical protein
MSLAIPRPKKNRSWISSGIDCRDPQTFTQILQKYEFIIRYQAIINTNKNEFNIRYQVIII